MPARIIAVAEIPRTRSGKISEVAVRDTIHGRAIANDTALLYTGRGRFIECGVLVREMPRYLRCAYLPRADVLTGHWQTALDRLVQLPRPAVQPAVDGADVAARWILAQLT